MPPRSSTSPSLGILSFVSWLGKWLLVLLDTLLAPLRQKPRIDVYHFHHEGTDSKTYPSFNLADLVKDRVPTLAQGFREAWWLPVGDAQTVYSSLGDFSKVDPIVYERKHIQVADGGLLTVDITPPLHIHPVQEGEVIIAVAHGFTGGSHEHYVRAPLTLLTAPVEAGGLAARGVVLNYRGCNGSPVISPRLYHAGSSDDYRSFISWVCYTFPKSKIFGVGFSLGANIVAKYAGEEGKNCPLSGVVTLANPWDFLRGSVRLERGTFINRIMYRYVMGGALQTLYNLHRKAFFSAPPGAISIELSRLQDALQRKKLSLKEFDDLITAPMFGYGTANDYYIDISSSKVAENVRVPLLSINARDDPMVADMSLPLDQIRKNPWIVLAVTQGGGHMGWFEQNPDGSLGRWYCKPVKEFIGALMECDLPARPKPKQIIGKDGWVRQEGRQDTAFTERGPDTLDLVASGAGESKLFSGW